MDSGFTDCLDLSRLEIGESLNLLQRGRIPPPDARTPIPKLSTQSSPAGGLNYDSHGTATLSVVVGQGVSGQGEIVPAIAGDTEVRVLPYRVCVGPGLFPSEMYLSALAIRRLVRSVERTLQEPPPHVVVMSLGSRGPYIGESSRRPDGSLMGKEVLRGTIREFTKRGVVIVAAAGQLPNVLPDDALAGTLGSLREHVLDPIRNSWAAVFPASLKEVISVGAFDRARVPNSVGFYGGAPLDIMAPGVDVRIVRAYRTADDLLDPVLETSSGSSYAAQFTAAAAALWIEHHGKDFLTRTYGLDRITDLFRHCLVKSGHPPHQEHLDLTDAPGLNVDCLLRQNLPTKAELESLP